ncbi:MAG: hypothetical protein HQL54_11075, partial [Magnetococcales bacterium]|nr:hypothetical protein [Magnetococcales bacterium]
SSRGAIVVGEDGSIVGIVTIKDVLNFIFGGVSEDMRLLEKYKVTADTDSFFLPGDMRLKDFNDLTNINVTDARMTTLGGFALRLFGEVPKVGDSVKSREGVKLIVTEMDRFRIQSLEVRLVFEKDKKSYDDSNAEEGVAEEGVAEEESVVENETATSESETTSDTAADDTTADEDKK